MLFNPEWKKPDIFSLSSLVNWLKGKPAMEAYDYSNVQHPCMLQRYFTEMGLKPAALGNTMVNFGGDSIERIPEGFRFAAQTQPWNYGAALKRAEAMLIKESVDA